MNTIEFTKIAAAVLCALLLIFGSKVAIEMGLFEHEGVDQAGYKLPIPEPAAAAPAESGAAPPAGFDFASVAALLPKANAENGAGIFKKCGACHTGESGGANKLGPNLWGVVGRKIASKEGFGYSEAIKGKGGEWTYENLAAFIHNPKAFAPGTKMIFAGVPDSAQLADLLAYLRTLSDSPAPLPGAP